MAIILRYLLDGLFARVNAAIQQATQDLKNAGIELEIEAGQEVSRAIEQAKNAYQQELELTIDKVSKLAKDTFDRLDSMVQRFEKATAAELQDLMAQAQQIANTMPMAKTQPQLTRVTPRYIVVDDTKASFFVIFKGNFPQSSKPGYEPSFTFADKACYLFDSTTQSFVFKVPTSPFKDTPPELYGYQTGKLIIPWDKGTVFEDKTQAEYRVGLGALPKLAGKGTVTYEGKETKRVTQGRSEKKNFNGQDHLGQKRRTEEWQIYPSEGWRIDVSHPP